MFEQTHELVLSLVRDGLVDGLRIDHPTASPIPPGIWPGCASAALERVWVEKILDPDERLRDWPVTGTVGYEFLDDVCALFVDPAGEEPLTRAVGAGLGRPPRVRRGRAARQARAGAGHVRAGGRAARPDARTRATAGHRRARSRPVRLARVPDLRRGRARSGRRRGPPRDRRGRPAAARAQAAAARGAGPGRVRHPLSADDAGDHGQGGRGHRLLPVLPAAGAQRRRRRPGRFGISVARVPRRLPRAGAAVPAEPAHDPDPRRQALGRRAGADRRARVDGRRVGRPRGALVRADRGASAPAARPTTSSATSSSRRSPAPGRSRPSGSRPTSRRRCARPSATRTGCEQNTEWEAAVKRFARSLYSHAEFLADFEPFVGPRRRRGRARGARAAGAEADRAGNSRHLPGRRAPVPRARRSGQPPPGRLGLAPGDAPRG